MSSIVAGYYAVKLRGKGKLHLEFLTTIIEEAGKQGKPKQQYEWAVARLEEHKKACADCSERIIKELSSKLPERPGVPE